MIHHRTLAGLLLLLLAGTACNALTGADDLSIGDPEAKKKSGGGDDDDDGNDDGGGGASSGSDTTSQGAGTPTGSTTSTTGAGQGQEQLVDVQGVSIRDVSFYQGVKAQLVQNGSPRNPSVYLVAGRDALVRVFPDISGYDGYPTVVRLLIEGQAPLEKDASLRNGTENDLGSSVNFDVPGSMIAPGARFRVEIKRRQYEAGAANPAASYPADGSYAPMFAEATGSLRITIVPIAYDADGSGRTPDTSAAQIAAYESLFQAIYPTSNLQLTVGATVGWPEAVSANGTGWGELLDAFASYRSQDGAGFDEYYYGIFNPASSAQAYCGGGCVAGLGYVGAAGDDYVRAAIGLGFGGDLSTGTAAHEVGHNHGRDHAPCGTSGDTNFPHSGAKIGEWGYDMVGRTMKNPEYYVDLMSYCSPAWVSDYNYNAFFNRIQAVNGMNVVTPDEARFLTYERVAVRPDGVTWLEPATIERPPIGERRTLRVASDDGAEDEVEAAYFRYDHLEGGLYVFPQGQRPPALVEMASGDTPWVATR